MGVLHHIRQLQRIKSMFLKQMCSDSSSKPPLSYFEKLTKLVEKSGDNTYSLNEEDIELITMRDRDRQRRLDQLLLKLFFKESQGDPVPKYVTLNCFQKAVQVEHEDPDEYVYYFYYYYEKDKSNIMSWMISKEEINVSQPPIHYLSHNTSCVAGVIDTAKLKQYYKGSSSQGMQFGQNFVLDFSSLTWIRHDHRMILAHEIRELVIANGKSRRPFHLHFCSYLKNDLMIPLVKYIAKGLQHSTVTLTADFYLNKFMRKDIVYLTPDSNNSITYNPDDVYVISPYHDRRYKRYHEARHDSGVRTATLPYGFKWQQQSKWQTLPEIHQLFTAWKELQGEREQKIKLKR